MLSRRMHWRGEGEGRAHTVICMVSSSPVCWALHKGDPQHTAVTASACVCGTEGPFLTLLPLSVCCVVKGNTNLLQSSVADWLVTLEHRYQVYQTVNNRCSNSCTERICKRICLNRRASLVCECWDKIQSKILNGIGHRSVLS